MKKIISILFSVIIASSGFAVPAAWADDGEVISNNDVAVYDEESTIRAESAGNEEVITYVDQGETKTLSNATKIDSNFNQTTLAGNYYVKGEVTLDPALTVDSVPTTIIVLCDGATLTLKSGMTISTLSSLSIYGQSEGTGKLVAGDSAEQLILSEAGFSLYGGVLEGKAGRNVITNNGLLRIKGGTITGGKVGVQNNGILQMEGGIISGNGTGIVYSDGASKLSSLSFDGGKVTGNETGVTVGEGKNAHVRKKPFIKGNTSNDVYLTGSSRIDLIGKLEDGAQIGVCLENGTGIFTTGYSKYHEGASPKKFFFCNDENRGVASVLRDNEADILDAVQYIDENGQTAWCSDYRQVSGVKDGEAWGKDGQTTWYVLDTSRSISKRIVLRGDVKIILVNGKKLSPLKGIEVKGSMNGAAASSLTIYGQEGSSGTLDVRLYLVDEPGNAPVGGNANASYTHCGNISIHGGTVNAATMMPAAAIGGAKKQNSGKITITGGRVSAVSTGRYDSDNHVMEGAGAAIGSGYDAPATNADIDSYSIVITGGSIFAHSYVSDELINDSGAAGIGSGNACKARYLIRISGGNIEAGSDSYNYNYKTQEHSDFGAGIGAGYNSAGADVYISGGTVKACQQHNKTTADPCIGGNIRTKSHVYLNYDDCRVTYSESKLKPDKIAKKDERLDAVTATGNKSVLIKKCDHSDYEYVDEGDTHKKICKTCSYETQPEAHEYSYGYTATQHRGTCPECGDRLDWKAHEFGKDGSCTICGAQGIKISFDGNGASGIKPSETIAACTRYTLPDTDGLTAPDGAKFLGWYVGNGTTLNKPGDTIVLYGSVVLKAVWQKKVEGQKHSVTIVSSTAGGTASVNPESAESGATVTLSAASAQGYKFNGWTVQSGNVTIADPASSQTTFTMCDEDVVVIVEFCSKTITGMDLFVEEEDGTQEKVTDSVIDLATGKTVKLIPVIYPQDAPYLNIIWKSDDPSVSVDKDGVVTAESAGTAKVTATINAGGYFATASCDIKAAEAVHTVTFDSDGGSAVKPQEVEDGSAAVKPEDPARDDYNFTGWQLNGSDYDFSTPVTADITLKATWSHNHKTAAIWNEKDEPSCTKGGSSGHYKCDVCNKYFTYSECTVEVTDSDLLIPAYGHEWGSWTTVTPATADEKGLEERVCDRCNKKETRAIPETVHRHSLKKVKEKAATCEDAGNIEYWICSGAQDACGRCFADEDRSSELQVEETLIPATGHSFGDWEMADAEKHKRVCANDSDHVEYSTHSWDGGTVTKKATTGEEGVKTYTCTVCKGIKTEVIPKLISIKNAKVTLSASAFTYNGKVRRPSIKTIGGKKLTAGTDYTVKWSNSSSKNVGTYTVTITGKGRYTGTSKAKYKINPKGTSLSKLAKGKKSVTVRWKKQTAKMSASRITGYQIQLATDSKFTKNRKTVTVKGYKKTSKTVRKLKAGKKYFVRVRTYKTVRGVKYYSPWSKVRAVKTK